MRALVLRPARGAHTTKRRVEKRMELTETSNMCLPVETGAVRFRREGVPDETAMMSLHLIVGALGSMTSRGADVEQERPSLDMIREHLVRQRGRG